MTLSSLRFESKKIEKTLFHANVFAWNEINIDSKNHFRFVGHINNKENVVFFILVLLTTPLNEKIALL